MTPQEKRVIDNLAIAVDFLLSDAPRSGRHNEVKAIRESLKQAKEDLRWADSDAEVRKANSI